MYLIEESIEMLQTYWKNNDSQIKDIRGGWKSITDNSNWETPTGKKDKVLPYGMETPVEMIGALSKMWESDETLTEEFIKAFTASAFRQTMVSRVKENKTEEDAAEETLPSYIYNF